MKIYLDASCYCLMREPSSSASKRVKEEIEAIKKVVQVCGEHDILILGSYLVSAEIERRAGRSYGKRILAYYDSIITKDLREGAHNIERRVSQLYYSLGLEHRGSYHIALAEAAGVGYFLTVDDRFETAVGGLAIKTKVISPTNFLKEDFVCQLLKKLPHQERL